MATGIFITIEGPEGSGKTTQARLLNEYLYDKGYDVLWTLEPGGTTTGKRIREILLHSEGMISGFTELMLFEAARAQHVRELLVPALERGSLVLCDRYADSTLAYQGYGRGINLQLIRVLDLLATAGLEPDATLLLDMDPAAGLARRLSKGKVEVRIGENGRAVAAGESGSLDLEMPPDADRFEREEIDFHRRVRRGFLSLAETNPDRFAVINADQPEEKVQADIRKVLDSLLSRAAETEPARRLRLESVRRNFIDGSLLEELKRLLGA